MSQATCRCIQNAASLPKYIPSLTAVSGVIARRPLTSSLTRRREICSAAARSVWLMCSGFRNRDSRNWPGCGGFLAARPREAGRLRPGPLPLVLSLDANILDRGYASGSRLNIRMPLIMVLITVEPRVTSSRNTMYVWISANSSM